jgi:hypothetical protein
MTACDQGHSSRSSKREFPRNVTRVLRAWCTVALFVATVCLPACGRSGLHPVRGRVSFADGAPVPTGRVVVSYGDGTASWGSINPDGSFAVGTLKQSDGMRPGTYRVAVKDAFVEVEKKVGEKVSVPLVHKRFADPATSGLEFKVPDKTVWEIVVEKP